YLAAYRSALAAALSHPGRAAPQHALHPGLQYPGADPALLAQYRGPPERFWEDFPAVPDPGVRGSLPPPQRRLSGQSVPGDDPFRFPVRVLPVLLDTGQEWKTPGANRNLVRVFQGSADFSLDRACFVLYTNVSVSRIEERA